MAHTFAECPPASRLPFELVTAQSAFDRSVVPKPENRQKTAPCRPVPPSGAGFAPSALRTGREADGPRPLQVARGLAQGVRRDVRREA